MSSKSVIQNIVGGWSVSDTRLANLSDSLNMFVETQGEGASATSILRSICGSELLLDINEDGRPIRGLYECSRDVNGNPVLFIACADSVYVITNEFGTWGFEKVGTINNLDTQVSMCETNGYGGANDGDVDNAHPHLIVVDGSQLYALNTELIPSDMASNWRSIALPYRVNSETQRIIPTHCAYLYGYLVVNDSTTDAFYITYQYPFERLYWNGEEFTDETDYDIFMIDSLRETEVGYKNWGFITYSEWSPDITSALYSNGTLLYTFGPKSTQIFNYNKDVDAPFVSPTNAGNSIGIKAVNSLAAVGDYLFYLGSSSIGENGIYVWQSNSLTRVSTPDIERQIQTMENPSDARGQCWNENGHLFYAITFIQDDYTLVYDIAQQMWHRRSSKDEYTNIHHKWRLTDATLHNRKLMFGTLDGKLVFLSNKKYDEYDSRPMIRMRRSGMLINNYQQFFIDNIKLICNTGDFEDNELNPRIMMRYSDKGGEWSNQEIGLLGQSGRYDYDVTFYNLGLHSIFCIEFSMSDPINFVIVNGTIQHSLCDRY